MPITGKAIYDMMNYHYFRGMLFTGMEMYTEALHAFRLVLELPVMDLHAYQVEASKKMVLLSVLAKKPGVKHYDDRTREIFKGFSYKNYIEMACRTYLPSDGKYPQQWFGQHYEELSSDGNVGLAKQVIERMRFDELETLPKTYHTITLADVKQKIFDKFGNDMEDTPAYDPELIIGTLISEGRLKAKIDKETECVLISDEGESVPEMVTKLEEQTLKIIETMRCLEAADIELIKKRKESLFLKKNE